MNLTRAESLAVWVVIGGLARTTGAGEPAAPAEAEARIETWLISGQSNACGQGKLPALAANPLVEAYDLNADKWVVAQDPLPGMGTTQLGPWHAAALEVAGATGKPLRLAGFAKGGMHISYWDRNERGWKALSETIKRAARNADVFLWYQGENDGGSQLAGSAYQEALKKLVAAVRAEAGNPRMTAVIVQLSRWNDPRQAAYMPIREAQRRFVAEDGNALLVPALGRKHGDYVHLGREGQLELGGEIGRALLKTRYDRKDVNWPGPVLDQAVLGADGRTVVAHFAEVAKLGGVEAADFGIVDAGGQAKVVQSLATNAVAGNALVTLTFSEPVKLPVSLIYGAGDNPKASLTDEAGNRAPAVQIEIIQGQPPEDKPASAPNGAGNRPVAAQG